MKFRTGTIYHQKKCMHPKLTSLPWMRTRCLTAQGVEGGIVSKSAERFFFFFKTCEEKTVQILLNQTFFFSPSFKHFTATEKWRLISQWITPSPQQSVCRKGGYFVIEDYGDGIQETALCIQKKSKKICLEGKTGESKKLLRISSDLYGTDTSLQTCCPVLMPQDPSAICLPYTPEIAPAGLTRSSGLLRDLLSCTDADKSPHKACPQKPPPLIKVIRLWSAISNHSKLSGAAKKSRLVRGLVPYHLLTNATEGSLVSQTGNRRGVFKDDLCVIQDASQTATVYLLQLQNPSVSSSQNLWLFFWARKKKIHKQGENRKHSVHQVLSKIKTSGLCRNYWLECNATLICLYYEVQCGSIWIIWWLRAQDILKMRIYDGCSVKHMLDCKLIIYFSHPIKPTCAVCDAK